MEDVKYLKVLIKILPAGMIKTLIKYLNYRQMKVITLKAYKLLSNCIYTSASSISI